MQDKMTVKEFLGKGHRFVCGDEIKSKQTGASFTVEHRNEHYHNQPTPDSDDGWIVIKATALESKHAKISYKPVRDSLFSLEEEFNNGELYFKISNGDYRTITKITSLTNKYHAGNVFRKIEITPMQVAKKACEDAVNKCDHVEVSFCFARFVNCTGSEFSGDCDKEFVNICRSIVHAYDK